MKDYYARYSTLSFIVHTYYSTRIAHLLRVYISHYYCFMIARCRTRREKWSSYINTLITKWNILPPLCHRYGVVYDKYAV